jgi:molecular chaperone GrpE
MQEDILQEEQQQEPPAPDPVAEELQATKDQLLRLAAEFDNFRKRCAKEREETALRAKCETLAAFLPVLDNFERAAAALQDEGVQMICRQFAELMAAQGARPFGAAGDAFDPALHHAVAHKDDPEQKAHVVDEVYSKGFRVGDRVIREAVVATRG